MGCLLGLGLFTLPANAQLMKCSDVSTGDTHPDGLNVSDVTFGLSTLTGNAANDCYGVYSTQGGAPSHILNAFNTAWPDSWEFLVKDDSDGDELMGNFAGIKFTLSTTNVPSSTSGNWTLQWEATAAGALPSSFDIGVAIKASNQAANYFFDDLVFPISPTSSNGSWEVTYKNNGGQIPAISGLWIYIRNGSSTPPIPPNPAPEPGILWLLATGLLGFRFAAKKRS